MKITENALRLLTRNILKELFTRKRGLSGEDFFGKEVDPHDYSSDYGGFGEADEPLEEDDESLEEEDLEEGDYSSVSGASISVSGGLSDRTHYMGGDDVVGPLPPG